MAFKVMTRKGHKQHLKELHIPLDSDLTSGLRDTRQAKLEEMKEMKEKVLGYERRQEEEAYQGMWRLTGVCGCLPGYVGAYQGMWDGYIGGLVVGTSTLCFFPSLL